MTPESWALCLRWTGLFQLAFALIDEGLQCRDLGLGEKATFAETFGTGQFLSEIAAIRYTYFDKRTVG
jgi:hypothetical protein